MGNFYVNFTANGAEREAIVEYLKAAKRKAFVGPTILGKTVFFDEQSDSQDESLIKAFGKRSSKNIGASVLAVLNHDDDILAYWLFKSGTVIDQYHSCPGYFEGDEEPPTGGDAKLLCDEFGVKQKSRLVEKVLRDEDYVFASERHEELAKLLKLPWPYLSMGYGGVRDGLLGEGISEEDLLEID